MFDLREIFFSNEKIANGLEKKLDIAISSNNQIKMTDLFSKEFIFLTEKRDGALLSNFLSKYLHLLKKVKTLKENIPKEYLFDAVGLLEDENRIPFALEICDCWGLDFKSIEILTRHGNSSGLISKIDKQKYVDKNLIEKVIIDWERYNGDVRKNSDITNALKNMAGKSITNIPDHPKAWEIIGDFKKAGELYEKKNCIDDAVRCYEKEQMYEDAFRLYKLANNKEGLSRTAEILGDLETAFEYAEEPGKKIDLLLKMEDFHKARSIAEGIDSPEGYFDLIRETARKRVETKIRSKDFAGAIELEDAAELETSKKNEISNLYRKHLNEKLSRAKKKKDIAKIYEEKLKLEENAGNFEEAGRIAEKFLEDFEAASVFYEKSNLYNKAIENANKHAKRIGNSNDAKLRLANLHEEAGNPVKAATLYESVGKYDMATFLYENTRHFNNAIDCLLKNDNPKKKVLLRLYIQAGRFDEAIELYPEMESFSDLEAALSIAETHKLTDHINVIKKRIDEINNAAEIDLRNYAERAKDEILNSYSKIAGIDFGTTKSVAALFNKQTGKVEIVPSSNPDNHNLEPSYFGLDEYNRPVFGIKAKVRCLCSPGSAVSKIKRSLGKVKYLNLGNNKYMVEEITAMILANLMKNVDKYLQSKIKEKLLTIIHATGFDCPGSVVQKFLDKNRIACKITNVVLTVPAYYNDNQKRATRESAKHVGLNVRRLLSEPIAAALAYGYNESYSGTICVVDMGGGTLGVSILEVEDKMCEVKHIGGDTKLGGSDIDEILVNHVISYINSEFNLEIDKNTHPQEIARLREACENMKIILSQQEHYTMEIPNFLGMPVFRFSFSRSELEKLSKPILARIEKIIKNVIKENYERIHNFILVGSSTRMPAVEKIVREVVNARPLKGRHDRVAVVAKGAAIQGAIMAVDIEEGILVNIVPYSLGIEVSEGDGKNGIATIHKIIDKNSNIPTQKKKIFTTAQDNQTEVQIKIYQGESILPDNNHFLGDITLSGIPYAKANIPQIEVIFDIGVDGILTVTAVEKTTNKKRSIRIEGTVSLTPAEMKRVKERCKAAGDIFEK